MMKSKELTVVNRIISALVWSLCACNKTTWCYNYSSFC